MRLRELRPHFRIVPGPATTIRRSAAWRLSMQAHRSESLLLDSTNERALMPPVRVAREYPSSPARSREIAIALEHRIERINKMPIGIASCLSSDLPIVDTSFPVTPGIIDEEEQKQTRETQGRTNNEWNFQ